MVAATEAPVEGTENQKQYIESSVVIGPANSAQHHWAAHEQIPRHEELDDQCGAANGVRRDLVQFISTAGLPVTLQPLSGLGSAGGSLAAVKEALALLKFLKATTGVIARTQRSVREDKRRDHLPCAHVMMYTHHATEVVVPLVALLPDLVKHLREKRPSMQFEFTIHSPPKTIWTAPGAPITDGAILKVLKHIEKGDHFIGIRTRSWKHWRTVRGFGEGDYGPWAQFKMPPGMKSLAPSP